MRVFMDEHSCSIDAIRPSVNDSDGRETSSR